MDNACILHVCLVLIIITPILTGGSLSMCDNYSYTATNFQLSRVQNDSTNCTCFLRSTEQARTQVEFNVTSFSGCKYKIGIYFNGSMPFLSCSSKSVFHTITSTAIKLNLEPGLEGSTETVFTLNITSTPETNLSLSCFTHNTTEISSTQHVTMTFTSPRKESSTSTLTTENSTSTEITVNSTSSLTTDWSTAPLTIDNSTSSPTTDNATLLTDSSAFTQTVHNSHVPVSSVYTSDIPVNKTNNMTTFPVTTTGGDKYIGEIVGGVIGCLVLIACITVIICVIKVRNRRVRKRKENRLSSTTDVDGDLKMAPRSPGISKNTFSNMYTNNNDSPNSEMIIIPNDVYVSMDTVVQPTFNTFNKQNPQMEIIENELYVSSDSVSKYRTSDNSNPEPKMEIIENDLYVSTDSVMKDQYSDNSNPEPKMEIIGNDLYVSSDSVSKYHTSDNSNPEPKMEIIENDLYVSTDSVLKDQYSDNRNPEPEIEIIENDLYVSYDNVHTNNDNPKPEITENDLYVSSDNIRRAKSSNKGFPKPEIKTIENESVL